MEYPEPTSQIAPTKRSSERPDDQLDIHELETICGGSTGVFLEYILLPPADGGVSATSVGAHSCRKRSLL